jgi:hypothetical protein
MSSRSPFNYYLQSGPRRAATRILYNELIEDNFNLCPSSSFSSSSIEDSITNNDNTINFLNNYLNKDIKKEVYIEKPLTLEESQEDFRFKIFFVGAPLIGFFLLYATAIICRWN